MALFAAHATDIEWNQDRWSPLSEIGVAIQVGWARGMTIRPSLFLAPISSRRDGQ